MPLIHPASVFDSDQASMKVGSSAGKVPDPIIAPTWAATKAAIRGAVEPAGLSAMVGP